MTRRGFVSLVGAGPGDPGLLTLKAQKRLQEADLIVYDYLANPQHLRHASPSAKIIGVGKGFRHKKIPQQRINALILKEARLGHRVVRLKGGDPFLFGRGGEEALLLKKNNIPFEVVPGITSAVACAAYAGIPMTHRDHNTSVTFITGHRANDGALDDIDWAKIVALDGTIAIYMGLYNLERITRHLMDAGLPSKTPTAVIEWGTLPYQRSCVAALDKIHDAVQKKKLQAPAMILVGEVVTLSASLNWFESLPLFGQKIVVTRMKDKVSELGLRLEALGAQVIPFPVIEIQKCPDMSTIDKAISSLPSFDWLVFTSAYGVDAFLGRLLARKKDVRALGSIKIAAVGAETAKKLKGYGLKADLVPDDFQVASLGELLGKHIKRSGARRVLLARTDIAPDTLEKILARYGARITSVAVYRTVRPAVSAAERKAALAPDIRWVAFTSSSAVTNFVKIAGPRTVKKMARKTRWASIGPVTSRTLRSFGLKVGAQARDYDLEGLVTALVKKGKR